MHPSKAQIQHFKEIVTDYYHQHGRHDMLWRQPEAKGSFDPYKIMVSEVMLQQTQVSRVTGKYKEFLQAFPSVHDLAAASLADVIALWSGLGYNRRAKFLWQAAKTIQQDFGGHFPSQLPDLVSLPGIGPNTAGAIQAYAYNYPAVFIETNIRTVFIHYFFADVTEVADKAIYDLLVQTIDNEHPREWYWALMDYGAYLKQTVGNLNKWSKSYAKQSKFAGSKRQLRGEVLRQLINAPQSHQQLASSIRDKRLNTVLTELSNEQMIRCANNLYQLG